MDFMEEKTGQEKKMQQEDSLLRPRDDQQRSKQEKKVTVVKEARSKNDLTQLDSVMRQNNAATEKKTLLTQEKSTEQGWKTCYYTRKSHAKRKDNSTEQTKQ